MEGGNPVLEWITYGIVSVVLLALGLLFLRTAWFFTSLLLIPVTQALGRTRFAGAVRRWGERGGTTATTPLDPATEAAIGDAELAGLQIPPGVRTGVRVGAALGAIAGVVAVAHGVWLGHQRGDGFGEVAATVGVALGLVLAPGVVVGAVLGAAGGAALDALWSSKRPRPRRPEEGARGPGRLA